MLWSHQAQIMEEKKIIDRLLQNTRVSEHPIIITNHDQQIVGVNDAWMSMCGYSLEEALGQTPKILQGELTDPATAKNFRMNLCQGRCCFMSVINYKKNPANDRKAFINHIFGWSIGDLYIAETFWFTLIPYL
tara:strand:+ start:583 stop:981 length:399 start_codon:yes stop_codon:yes gene_type:complete